MGPVPTAGAWAYAQVAMKVADSAATGSRKKRDTRNFWFMTMLYQNKPKDHRGKRCASHAMHDQNSRAFKKEG
jgi:hypothetical protein